MFFVRPEFSAENEGKLKSKAITSAVNFSSVPRNRKQKIKSRVLFLAELAASAGVGAIITALFIR